MSKAVSEMARYIDADALIENIKRDYCTDCNNYNGVRCRACGTDDAFDMIENAPTADVAPRAEVEKLQEVNADLNESLRLAAEANKDLREVVDRLRFNLKAVLDERAEDKAEVAREIFEEINKIGVVRQVIRSGKIIYDVTAEYDALKKKYTEEQ